MNYRLIWEDYNRRGFRGSKLRVRFGKRTLDKKEIWTQQIGSGILWKELG
jgi:hypothetical protein